MQGYGYGYGGYVKKTTRKDIVENLRCMYNASDVVLVDEFDSMKTRHVCPDGKVIHLLDKIQCPMQFPDGVIMAEVFYCRLCRKLIVNRSSIEIM